MEGELVTIVQARMSSTRLPGKALADICGKPMVQHVLDAAPEPRILAVPNEPESVYLVKALGDKYQVYMPDAGIATEDVLGRFWACVQDCEPQARWVLRLTADCPMLTADYVAEFLRNIWVLTPNTIYTNRFLDMDGYDMELFSVRMLRETAKQATDPGDREHVTSYMYRVYNVRRVSTRHILGHEEPGKCSVDTQEELDCVRKLMEERKHGT